MASTLKKILIIAVAELVYLLGRNELNIFIQGDIQKELIITVWRILSAVFYFKLCKNIILSRTSKGKYEILKPLIIVATIIWLSEAVLVGNWNPNFDAATKIVFVLTSIIVGIREEFLYRGVVQNIIVKKTGIIPALLISNIFFVLMHFGFQSLSALNAINMFLAGMFLGIIYEKTDNLFICIALHALYDMIYVFTPILKRTLVPAAGNFIILTALIILLLDKLRIKQLPSSKNS